MHSLEKGRDGRAVDEEENGIAKEENEGFEDGSRNLLDSTEGLFLLGGWTTSALLRESVKRAAGAYVILELSLEVRLWIKECPDELVKLLLVGFGEPVQVLRRLVGIG